MSLKQGQSRYLLIQTTRHHTAQLQLFRKGLAVLEALNPHIKRIAEEQRIDHQLSELGDESYESVASFDFTHSNCEYDESTSSSHNNIDFFSKKNLMDLKEAQLKLKLPDEIAADMFRDYTQKHIEEYISSALEVMKSQGRVRGSALKVIEELNKLLAYNQALTDLKNNGDKERLSPGIGSVSVLGGEYDSDRKIDELRQLYKAYATEAFSSGCLEDDKVSALNQLKNIFSLGNRETETIHTL